ncbi:laminin EGF-like domain-containing protein [Trichonephila clavipes]|nr:laminin EGF-like domain-containing protein [Trichonephila clavipes]
MSSLEKRANIKFCVQFEKCPETFEMQQKTYRNDSSTRGFLYVSMVENEITETSFCGFRCDDPKCDEATEGLLKKMDSRSVLNSNKEAGISVWIQEDRSIADGTLPLIAVIVTLGVLLLVAAMATCYRYWDYRRHQPRIPFWSIELQDEKTDLHSHCQYQHLDAATSKTVSAAPPPIHQSNGEVGRLNSDSLRRTYNTINV